MKIVERVFQVGGKPFFPLGGQSRNSSGYNESESETAFKAVKLLHGNTLEIPVYWEQVEPEEGQFDFSSVDALLASARRHGLKLVLLWFGTWKNGNMEYVPEWAKTDPARFKRVTAPSGKDVWVLSSHCQANLNADRAAFCALCEHLKAEDGEGDVIALQIENEPGILGSDRDYGPEGQAAFEGEVPAELVAKMRAAGGGPVHDLWQAAGGAASGSWPELFGWSAGELLTAWSIATYIDQMAIAGKAILNIPMYVNVWSGKAYWRVPGESYPSGGATAKTLDIYKWAAPHLDLIAPDIYAADSRGYEGACIDYAREDNALFIPESAPGGSNAWNMFRAIGEYDAIGYACFAVEHMISEDGSIRPGAEMIVDSFRAISAAIPLLLEHQGSGRIHALVQEENMASQFLDLEGYVGIAYFGDMTYVSGGKDWRHPPSWPTGNVEPKGQRGRGLLFQVAPHEFYMLGAGCRLFLRPKLAPELQASPALSREHLRARLANYVRVDEGHFDGDGQFVVDRRRNGDETDNGIWVEADVGVVHVVLCE